MAGVPVLCLVLVLVLVPAAYAAECLEYRDSSNRLHSSQSCPFYCCGHCKNRYCCSRSYDRLSQEQQEICSRRSRPMVGPGTIGGILGSILGTIVPIITCVGLITCCVAPCCCLYKKCRKRRNQAVVTTTTVVHGPAQGPPPSQYEPFYPGYQPLPVQPGFGGPPMPSAPPPSYMEAVSPGFPLAPYPQAPPPFPLKPPELYGAGGCE